MPQVQARQQETQALRVVQVPTVMPVTQVTQVQARQQETQVPPVAQALMVT